MKSTMRAIIVALAVVMVAGWAAAQGAQQPIQSDQQRQQQMGAQYRPLLEPANELIGMEIHNNQGQRLGALSEIVLEPNLNYVSYGVLSTGGFAGLGEKYFAIPWDTFELATGHDSLILNIPKQAFEQAKGFNKNRWPQGRSALADASHGPGAHDAETAAVA